MNRLMLRSAVGRTLPDLEHNCQPHRTYFNQFSTTATSFDAEKPPTTPASPVQQRTRAATGQISSMARGRGQSNSRGGFQNRGGFQGRGGLRGRGGGSAATGGPPEQRSLASGSRFAGIVNAASDGAKVLDIKQMPRGGFRGGLRGNRAGARGARGGFGGRGGFQGPGRRPPPGVRGGSATRGGTARRGRGDRERQGGSGRGDQKEDPDTLEDLAESAFHRRMAFGERTNYNPSLTLGSLEPYMPAWTNSIAGKKNTILENLATLGTSEPVNAPARLTADSYVSNIQSQGLGFFADLKGRAYTEASLQGKEPAADGEEALFLEYKAGTRPPRLGGAEDAVKTVILDKAVAGNHEKPAFAEDAAGLARSAHLRSHTYTTRDLNAFQKKLSSLIAGRKAAKPAARQPTA